MSNLPIVAIFGRQDVVLKSGNGIPDFETSELDCRCYSTDDNLMGIIAKDDPKVFVTFGDINNFPKLLSAPFFIRNRWLHFPEDAKLSQVGKDVFCCFINSIVFPRKEVPLVSVFTPSYNSGNRILRPYNSLLEQDYKDWEWVIVDDSDDNDETWKMLCNLAENDSRIKLLKTSRHSGVIGNVKRTACGHCRGKYLIELDHDDELTITALSRIVTAFEAHPECGFVYTDFAESFVDGTPVYYPDGWGFGYGKYRDEIYNGVKYAVPIGPNINPKTIRHIVAAPNHARCWRKDFYNEIGGHSDILHVADDYELLVRTFLKTRMCRVPYLCYIQYRQGWDSGGNTHRIRNRDIQRLVRYFSTWYDKQIHERFVELEINDFVWKKDENTFMKLGMIPNQIPEQHVTITAE